MEKVSVDTYYIIIVVAVAVYTFYHFFIQCYKMKYIYDVCWCFVFISNQKPCHPSLMLVSKNIRTWHTHTHSFITLEHNLNVFNDINDRVWHIMQIRGARKTFAFLNAQRLSFYPRCSLYSLKLLKKMSK